MITKQIEIKHCNPRNLCVFCLSVCPVCKKHRFTLEFENHTLENRKQNYMYLKNLHTTNLLIGQRLEGRKQIIVAVLKCDCCKSEIYIDDDGVHANNSRLKSGRFIGCISNESANILKLVEKLKALSEKHKVDELLIHSRRATTKQLEYRKRLKLKAA